MIDAMPYRLWVNQARTVLVRMWDSGLVEVCFRDDAGDTWGPAIRVVEER
ncbi:MAG TPA: hypothetical protein VJN72_07205 [Gaiellales bacterium]|nr:hypothetical protein [Gaiellales bacterium]